MFDSVFKPKIHNANTNIGIHNNENYILYGDYEVVAEELDYTRIENKLLKKENESLKEQMEAEKLYYEHQIKKLKEYCIELGGFFE